jgi:peptidoglycan/LPS O-acetylase OafA/YrhL
MPSYLTNLQLWSILWPIPVAAAVIAALAASPLIRDRKEFARHLAIFFSFAMLGFVVGELTGQSREASVAATIGAVLTLLGGALVYLLGQSDNRQVVTSGAVAVLALCLLLGANWGAAIRADAIAASDDVNVRIHREIEEQKLRDLRDELGLPQPSAAQPQTQR